MEVTNGSGFTAVGILGSEYGWSQKPRDEA